MFVIICDASLLTTDTSSFSLANLQKKYAMKGVELEEKLGNSYQFC